MFKLFEIFRVCLQNAFGFYFHKTCFARRSSIRWRTNVVQIKNNEISEIIIDPQALEINADKFENLQGDDAEFNAKKIIDIFKGEDNDFSKAVCLNAAAGLVVSENHTKFIDAYKNAKEHILSGKAYKHLETIQNG